MSADLSGNPSEGKSKAIHPPKPPESRTSAPLITSYFLGVMSSCDHPRRRAGFEEIARQSSGSDCPPAAAPRPGSSRSELAGSA